MNALGDAQRQIRDAVLGTGDLAARGLAVHRRTVQGSLANALAATFPVTRRIIGGRDFADVARAFAVNHPPHRPQLSAYGGDFPGHLTNHDLPYLADVARLEWARAEAYFAADAPALDFARFAAMAADDIAAARLTLHPATRLIASSFPIQRIWDVNQRAEVPPVDMNTPESVLVTRRGHVVTSRAISPGDASFLRNLSEGKSLGEAAAGVADLQAVLEAHFIGETFRA